MTDRTISHGTFVVERDYPAKPARVFAAWSDPKVKRKWFGGPQDETAAYSFDFKVGGKEYSAGKIGGQMFSYEALYYDIVPDTRIVYSYEMHIDEKRISVSVASVELTAKDGGTHLIVTEHGAFLDGLDKVEQRQSGTEWLMDQLGEMLARDAAN